MVSLSSSKKRGVASIGNPSTILGITLLAFTLLLLLFATNTFQSHREEAAIAHEAALLRKQEQQEQHQPQPQPQPNNNPQPPLSSSQTTIIDPFTHYQVDETCTSLPPLRESGTFFLDTRIHPGISTPDVISPSFKVGSYYPDKVQYHMAGDAANFHLIKRLVYDRKQRLGEGQDIGISIDIGANQGFYTYYLATLGLPVHSFEIYEPNYKALLHGKEFNPREVSERVHVYAVGIGEKNGRFDMKGGNYDGFLTEGGGSILGVTLDCFSYHKSIDGGGGDWLSNVAFVKVDVEGFEIAAFRGMRNSLFREGSSTKVGGLIVEVGPDRWGRANIGFEVGVEEMKNLAENHFEKSYILLRAKGGHVKTCPVSLADVVSDKNPEEFEGNKMYEVKLEEWEPLLKKMESSHFDCNFYFKN